ncbi:tape measure protein [Gilliamella apicola]|uniref:Tape measure protein N-terminal domain-containing protein n=1 Tax=Gilliamella apicola TaxID=1196095 RepID=A0A2V4DXX7_9GAMM|nr:tape measure protein [Gilliamella apicola]PXZ04339.1 hypothetical protein DKK79_08240 [Gilliamella apicola]
MSFEAGSIFYTIEAKTGALLTADKEVSDFNKRAQAGFEKTSAAMSKLTTIAKAVSAALVSSTVIAYAQSWNELEDRIQNTGATASQTKDILDQLLATSDRNGRTIEESSELYIRLSNSMGELGYSTQSTLSYIDTLSNLLTINKTSSVGAESAINALTKAQMKGKLAGVEAMSVFNAMPSILKTLGKQLKKTETEVRQLATDGKLSMSQFTDAMIAAQEETAALADNMRNTVQDGINRVTNNLKKYLGEMNNSTGATKLLVDSLILMSEHVDVLVTGVGALAAIYAGKYITSLANATKQSAEKVIENIKLATSERNLAKEELRSLEVEGKKLTARRNELVALKSVTTSKIQLAAIEKQLSNIDKQRTLLIDKEAAAQAKLASATKLSTLAANGLKSAMALLGGPAGLLLLTAGALVTWSSKAAAAKQKALELTDEVAALAEKYKGLSKAQREAFAIDLKKQIFEQNKAIEKQIEDIENINNKLKINKKEGKDVYGDNASLEERKKSLEKILAVMQEGFNKAVDLLDEVIVKNHEAADSTDKVAKSTNNLSDSLNKTTQSKIDEKIKSLSTELEISEMKLSGAKKAAYIYESALSELGDESDKYKVALLGLINGTAEWADMSDEVRKTLEPLLKAYGDLFDKNEQLSASNKKGRSSTKSYAEETKKLKDELQLLQQSYGNSSADAQIFRLEHETNTKIIGKEREKLKELFDLMDGYKTIDQLKNPLQFEEDSYNNAKTALDDWFQKNPTKYSDYYSKLEQLEKQHQINLAKIKSDATVSKIDDAVAQVDPVQALQNENARKLALIQEFEKQKWITEQNAIALREAANRQYEQNRINAQWEIWRNQSDANEFLASSLEGLASSATSTISGLMSGTMTATQAMQNFANVILNEAIGSLVQMGMQYVKNAIVEQSASAAATAAHITEAEALAIAYQPAAMLASIATQGAAATIGAESYMTALGTMKAFSIAGARKNGGPVDANNAYRVGEDGKPEIFMQGGRQYLIPGENGQVLSNRQITSGNANIQWSFVVENYASNVEVSQPSIDVENRIIRMAVKQAEQKISESISNHSGDVWNAMSNSTNVQSKL